MTTERRTISCAKGAGLKATYVPVDQDDAKMRDEGRPPWMSPGTYGRAVWREFFGTYFALLVIYGMFASAVHPTFVSHIGVGLTFAGVVWYSGAACNPSITFAQWAFGKFDFVMMLLNIVAQLCAGMIAAVTVRFGCHLDMALAAPVPSPGFSLGTLFLCEMLGGTLCFIAYIVASASRLKDTAPLYLGLIDSVTSLFFGPITGAQFNIARSLGSQVVSGVWESAWIYYVAPIVAMCIAMLYVFVAGSAKLHVVDIYAQYRETHRATRPAEVPAYEPQ